MTSRARLAGALGRGGSTRPRGDMPFLDHLGELRRRLVVCLVAVAAGSVVGFVLWDWLLQITTEPYCEAQARRDIAGVAGSSPCQLYINDVFSLVTTRLSVAAYIGVILSMPVIVWQLWRFVTPGLERNEKRYAVPFLASSILLFAAGAALAWFSFPKALAFFLAVGGDQIVTLFTPGPYLKLILLMMLGFGAAFEMPVVLVFLQLAGVVTSRRLRSWRRQAIVVNFIVAAVVTPSQDPYSLLILAVPLVLLYEMAIIVGRLAKR